MSCVHIMYPYTNTRESTKRITENDGGLICTLFSRICERLEEIYMMSFFSYNIDSLTSNVAARSTRHSDTMLLCHRHRL